MFLTQVVIYSQLSFDSRSCGIPAADNLFMFGLFSKSRLAGNLKGFAEFAPPSHDVQVAEPACVLYLTLHPTSFNWAPTRRLQLNSEELIYINVETTEI